MATITEDEKRRRRKRHLLASQGVAGTRLAGPVAAPGEPDPAADRRAINQPSPQVPGLGRGQSPDGVVDERQIGQVPGQPVISQQFPQAPPVEGGPVPPAVPEAPLMQGDLAVAQLDPEGVDEVGLQAAPPEIPGTLLPERAVAPVPGQPAPSVAERLQQAQNQLAVSGGNAGMMSAALAPLPVKDMRAVVPKEAASFARGGPVLDPREVERRKRMRLAMSTPSKQALRRFPQRVPEVAYGRSRGFRRR